VIGILGDTLGDIFG